MDKNMFAWRKEVKMTDPILLNHHGVQISVKERRVNNNVVIIVDNIISIEYSSNNYVVIHYFQHDGKYKKVETRGTVSDFIDLLPKSFFRIERPTIINMQYLVSYTVDTCRLEYGEHVFNYYMAKDVSTKFVELDF